MCKSLFKKGDANWHNQKGKRAGLPPVEPLYTLMDAEEAIHMLETVEYGWLFDLCEGVKVRFNDAGHLLRSISWWLRWPGGNPHRP